MAANQFMRHRKAQAKLKEIFESADKAAVIHYSCESFYDLPDGRSPRVTSIAVRNLDTGQTESFSIHQRAELRRIPMTQADIEPYYNELESEMIQAFYDYVKLYPAKMYLHWNMRDKNYGFQAIEHRFRVLGGDPFVIEDSKKVDISRLFIELYGVSYIGHPRLEKLLEANKIEARDFLNGAGEAKAFVDGKYVDLHRSTLRKVDVLANLASRAYDEKLKTLASWREARGLSLSTIVPLAKEHWLITSVIILGGLVSAGLAFWRLGAAISSGTP
jgi:hypothetical protein